MMNQPNTENFVVIWLIQPEVCHKIFVCVYYGLHWYHSLVQWKIFFSLLKHRAKTMTTEAASVSLNRFTCRNLQAK
jgi:hypothetical protein